MSDRHTLQYLVDLIDDDTEEVRKEILRELVNYGNDLEEDLQEFSADLDEQKLEILEPILLENRRQWLFDNWNEWLKVKDEYESLEEAMNLITKFQFGPSIQNNLSYQISSLAEGFMNRFPYGNEFDLANYLFKEKLITGSKIDYYNPLNSNLLNAIENKQGLPITLSILYMLVGDRAGLLIQGCNFPGHFLAKIEFDREVILVDCFNGGRMIYETELRSMVKNSYDAIMKIVNSHTSTRSIVRRVLNNLSNAYKQKGDKVNSEFFANLIRTTPW